MSLTNSACSSVPTCVQYVCTYTCMHAGEMCYLHSFQIQCAGLQSQNQKNCTTVLRLAYCAVFGCICIRLHKGLYACTPYKYVLMKNDLFLKVFGTVICCADIPSVCSSTSILHSAFQFCMVVVQLLCECVFQQLKQIRNWNSIFWDNEAQLQLHGLPQYSSAGLQKNIEQ